MHLLASDLAINGFQFFFQQNNLDQPYFKTSIKSLVIVFYFN